MSSLNKPELIQLSKKIAYITINPRGNFLKSVQLGFKNVGLRPEYLIYVKPTDRLLKEFKKYRLSFFNQFLLSQFKRHFGNKESFSREDVDINIPKTVVTKHLNSDESIKIIQNLGIKYLINCGAGIFRKKLLSITDLIILNAHAGKLPEYKNMNVVEWTICNGDDVVGTVHRIDEGIDTGPVWLKEVIDISGTSSLLEAREIAFDHVAKMIGKAVILNERSEITSKQYPPNQGRNWYTMHSYFARQVDQLLQENKV